MPPSSPSEYAGCRQDDAYVHFRVPRVTTWKQDRERATIRTYMAWKLDIHYLGSCMNLHLLRIFVTVVEANSFSRAADLLGISQPATSKAVRELEAQLDTVLLDRRGKSFRPSEPGQVLYDHGRAIIAIEREADEAVKSFYTLESGRLVIGASTTIATYWLPPMLKTFHSRHPRVELRVIGANTRRITELLLDCQVDVALVEGVVAGARIDIRPWRTEEVIVIAPRGADGAIRAGDAALASAAAATWIMRERGSGSRDALKGYLKRSASTHRGRSRFLATRQSCRPSPRVSASAWCRRSAHAINLRSDACANINSARASSDASCTECGCRIALSARALSYSRPCSRRL